MRSLFSGLALLVGLLSSPINAQPRMNYEEWEQCMDTYVQKAVACSNQYNDFIEGLILERDQFYCGCLAEKGVYFTSTGDNCAEMMQSNCGREAEDDFRVFVNGAEIIRADCMEEAYQLPCVASGRP